MKDDWSPVAAEVDCLGSGDDDIDREGRYGLHTQRIKAFVNSSVRTLGKLTISVLDQQLCA